MKLKETGDQRQCCYIYYYFSNLSDLIGFHIFIVFITFQQLLLFPTQVTMVQCLPMVRLDVASLSQW